MAASTDIPAEIKHPLSRWEKIKTGVKGFAKGALHYVPHGLLLVPIVLGGFALLGAATGWFTPVASVGQFVGKVATGILLGSLISGGVGAYQQIKTETQKRDAEIAAQQEILHRHRARAPEREVEAEPIEAPRGLPLAAEVTGHTIIH